jgi:hypothetical protein
MKNIHLIPTDKPSRLHYFTANKAGYYLYPNNGLVIPRNPNCINQNIYITSDEEIKEGDWVLDLDCIGRVKKADNLIVITSTKEQCWYYKKIILTTDPELIADGVQAIDDEFLNWFVKNPSCESVKVERLGTFKKTEEVYVDEIAGGNYYEIIKQYKIIIPQEEPKQETLEEAAKRTYQKGLQDDIDLSFYDGVRLGAKWQSDRMYSEEEVLIILDKFLTSMIKGEKTGLLNQWFEQFKKK